MRRNESTAKDLGLLALRLTTGGLLAGHGAQKLFGAFGGYGLKGTAGWLESIGLKPGQLWAALAGGSEFGSGLSMALGLFSPLGAISALGPMAMAWIKVHAGKPIWVTAGGAELPLTNIAVATALALTGPGRYSLDEAFGIKVPKPLIGLALAGVAAGISFSFFTREPSEQEAQQAGGELQAEDRTEHTGEERSVGA